MSKKYPNLLSPMKIGDVVFRNRLIASRASPILIQGSEPYPTEAHIVHYANKAKNGAAVVTCSGSGTSYLIPGEEPESRPLGEFDIYDVTCQRYLSQLTEAIHFYGAKASMQIVVHEPPKYDVSTGTFYEGSGMSAPRVGEEIPADLLEGIAEDYVRQAVLMKQLGFDMVYVHMAYRRTILGRFLSPLINKRTDQYGGSLENMARFPLTVADRIKQKCGKDFLIEASVSGCEPPGGRTLEETIELAKMFAGHVDLLQIRAPAIERQHITNFTLERTPYLYMAEAIKKSGADLAIQAVCGFLDMDFSEDVIASGKADFIAMGRGWISNPDYGRLAYEGRGEDVVPCLRCNACFWSNPTDPFTSVCSVNPVFGLEHKIERMIEPPTDKKVVAVVGGGPAGMKAALVAAGRGHHVTLYEKSDALGGLLKTVDGVSFKWPQRDFKNYLVRQIEKSDIKVLLNTEATPKMLTKEAYDAVIVAAGAEPTVPQIPGVDGKNVVFAEDVFGKEDTLAKKVVIIGGGEVGVETGMQLADKGHEVTLLEMQDKLAPDAVQTYYHDMLKGAWEKLENFKPIVNARCTGIGGDKVTYVDASGAEHSIEAGSVVIAVGMKPKNDLGLEFYNTADRVFIIGDCSVVGNVQKAIRSAFATASML